MQDIFKIEDIKRATYNPRTMPESEMQSLKESIKLYGVVEPVVINTHKDRRGVLVGGHQRITAIEQLLAIGTVPKGITKDHEGKYHVPAVLVDLDPDQEKALNIALNRISGEWDENKLYDLIVGLKDSPLITSTGFSAEDVASILDRGEQSVTVKTKKSTTEECSRCLELKLQVMGHAKRSGHPIEFVDLNK